MEAKYSSETSAVTITTLRNISEGGILYVAISITLEKTLESPIDGKSIEEFLLLANLI
jgi:hypothetical protein